MRIAVIDDQKSDREYLSSMINAVLADEGSDACCVEEYESGRDFLAHFKKDKYDLVFLDIYMDVMNGIETAERIRRTDTQLRLVLVSTSNDFASESYAVRADYYLLKPYAKEDLVRAMARLQISASDRNAAVTLPNGQEIPAQSIIYTSFSGHYVTIHRPAGDPLKIRCAQKEIEQSLLPCGGFVICTKGMIANLACVSRLESTYFIMSNGDFVPISRRKYSAVKQAYSEFLIKKIRGGGVVLVLFEIRILESVLYSLVNFLPYFFLALYPFTGNFRFSKRINAALFALLILWEIAVSVWASVFSTHNAPVSFMNTLWFAVVFFLAVKEHPGKQLFVLLMISNFANQTVFAAKCLEGFLFPALALESNRWSFSVSTIIVQLLFIPWFFWFEKKHFKEAITLQTQERIWRFLWLIPGIFYLFWFYLAYLNPLSGIQLALNPVYTAFAIFINSGALLIYYVVAKAVESFALNTTLQKQNDLLAVQNLQYEHLKYRMDEARQARHDLRQHMTVLQTFCENKEYGQLSAYLQDCLKSLPTNSSITYCDHFALNALLVYYDQIARERKIDLHIRTCIPQDIPVSDTDLTVLFGNLLENACDGCTTVPEDMRSIQLWAETPNQGTLVLSMDNTFSGAIQMKEGQYMSSKHEGTGMGIQSVQSIVNHYNGTVRFTSKGNIFSVSIVLYFQQNR